VPWLGGLMLLGSLAISGCTSSSGADGSPNLATGSAGPSSAAASAGPDFCTLAAQIGTNAGIMTNKVVVASDKWTAAQLKNVVTQTLAIGSQLVASAPVVMRSALQTELDTYKSFQDSNYNPTALQSSDFIQARNQVDAYEHNSCGFTFST
jgi:hypothetical protein